MSKLPTGSTSSSFCLHSNQPYVLSFAAPFAGTLGFGMAPLQPAPASASAPSSAAPTSATTAAVKREPVAAADEGHSYDSAEHMWQKLSPTTRQFLASAISRGGATLAHLKQRLFQSTTFPAFAMQAFVWSFPRESW
jgi:hypothetical protein